MSATKKKAKKKPKKNLIEMTFKSLMFWGGGMLFLLIWTFILGILVGRGHLSFGIMKDKISGVHELVEEKGLPPSGTKKALEDPKFAFYEELSSKKVEATRKTRLTAPKKSIPKKTPKKTGKGTGVKKELVKPVHQYVLQIGSFGDKGKASVLVERLKKMGHPAYSMMASVDGKLYYRVKCGPFKTEKMADAFKKKLAEKEDIHGFVTKDRK